MKRSYAGIVVFLLALATVQAAETSAPSGAAPDVQKGAVIWKAKCKTCHESPAMAKVLNVDPDKLDLTKSAANKVEDLVKVITDGKGKMPSYKDKLNDQELKDVVAYIQSRASPK